MTIKVNTDPEVWVFIVFIIISIIMVIIAAVYVRKQFKISLNIQKELKKNNVVKNYFEYLLYVKERLPFGGLSKNFSNFYDEDDSEELKKLKAQSINNIKNGRKIMLFGFTLILFNLIFSEIIS